MLLAAVAGDYDKNNDNDNDNDKHTDITIEKCIIKEKVSWLIFLISFRGYC